MLVPSLLRSGGPAGAAAGLVVVWATVLACGCTVDRSGSRERGGGGGEDAGVEMDAETGDATMEAGFDGGPPEDGAVECIAASDECTAGTARVCNEDAGRLVTHECPLGCAPGEPRCARIIPSNVDPSLLPDNGSPLTLDFAIDTTACDHELAAVHPQLDGDAEVCIFAASTIDVPAEQEVRVSGDRPLVLLASEAVTIAGTLDLSAYGRESGPGGGAGGDTDEPNGGGRFGGAGGDTDGSFDDGGGGGGGLCGSGGNGGDGDDADGGPGGGRYDDSYVLSPLRGGSGGGWARGASGSGYDNSGYGGGGGGALQITSRQRIAIEGAILAGGGGGVGGKRTEAFLNNFGAGGGGGSGGAVLLEAPAIDLGDSGHVRATGGGGGGSASGASDTSTPMDGWGEDGQDGAETADRASGGEGAGERYGADGGDSGGGDTLGGDDGGSNDMRSANGGGGGGGAGCILFRNADGELPAGTERSSPRTGRGLRALEAVRQ